MILMFSNFYGKVRAKRNNVKPGWHEMSAAAVQLGPRISA